MKSIDEITRLSAEDLERISLDESIPVPEELSARVQAAVRKPARWALPAGIAAAVATLLAVGLTLTRNPEPVDTFDDPYLAYAEVEKAFQTISDKMSDGMQIARKAGSAAEMPQNILNKIQEK